jgi:hypothetical protein
MGFGEDSTPQAAWAANRRGRRKPGRIPVPHRVAAAMVRVKREVAPRRGETAMFTMQDPTPLANSSRRIAPPWRR